MNKKGNKWEKNMTKIKVRESQKKTEDGERIMKKWKKDNKDEKSKEEGMRRKRGKTGK